MLRSASVALAACALSVVLSACGSDSDKEPVAGDITLTVTEDKPTTFTLSGLDPNGDAVTGTVEVAPTKGDLVITGGTSLTFTYTPHANDNGVDFFTYRVSDGQHSSNLGRVAIAIGAVDDIPAIQPTLTTDEDASVTATLITDVEGDTFTSTIVTPPSNGTLTVDPADPGKFTYVPNADFNGTDSIGLSASYTAADATTATVTGTVAITVRPVDDPPAAGTDSVHTLQGTAARFEPLANDRNVDGGALTVRITSAPSVGTATVDGDGSIRYTPTDGFVGNTSLEYEVRDARGLTARATMSIGVGLTSGILYLSRPDYSAPNELYFSDGARSFKVNAELPAGESVYSLKAAKSEPIVFYQTQPSSRLYRVDLREPGIAQLVDPADAPGSDFVIQQAAAPTSTGTTGPRAADGSFEVLVSGDLYVLNLRDASQLMSLTNGKIVKTPTLVPNF